MTITNSQMLTLLGIIVLVGAGLYLRRRAGTVLADVRAQFLTVPGFVVALIWWCVISGAFSSYIIFQVKVMGNDVAIGGAEEEETSRPRSK